MSISPYSGFTSRATGYIVTATEWNTEFTNFINYMNTTLVLPLSTVSSNKGALLTGDGTNLQILLSGGSGNDGKLLTLDSTQAFGVKWASVVSTTVLTIKGDLLAFSSAIGRLPVGTDGQVLTARAAATFGIDWETPAAAATVPSGVIVAYNPSYGGNSIPTGYSLCDGTSSTPNLIGSFIVGGQLTGGSSAPATSGYGNLAPNTYQGSTSFSVSVTISGSTGGPTGTIDSGTVIGNAAASNTHTHSVSGSGGSSGQTFQPFSYVLVYIQKN